MYPVILERRYHYGERSFALCQSCYWMATIFTKINKCPACPACHLKIVEIIPLNLDEKYEYGIDQNKGPRGHVFNKVLIH